MQFMIEFFNKHKVRIIAGVALLLGILTIWSFTKNNNEQPKTTAQKTAAETTEITLVFGGDMMGHGPLINAAYDKVEEKHNYLPWFKYISPYIKSADYSIANLEVTLAGPPYTGYPQFSSPDDYASNIIEAGFTALVTANNHSQDRGADGLIRTLEVLDKLKIPHTGTFKDTQSFESSYPLMVTLKGIKVAFLNATYGTNGLIVKHPTMVNLLDTIWMKKAILKARKLGAEIVIPIVHWGVEYQSHENKEQQNMAKFLADQGVDAIVGMHPHVVQPIYEIKSKSGKKVPVAFSLGNFVSNQRDRYQNGGILFRLKFEKKKDKISVQSHDYLPFWVHRVREGEQDSTFKRGYFMLTEKQLSLLNGEDLQTAGQYFFDTKNLLKDEHLWVN